MNSKSKVWHSNLECIPQDMLIAYLSGGLSGTEMNRVERHLAGCPMCADELEGLSQLNNPSDIKDISIGIDHRIDLYARGGKVNNVRAKVYLQAAATFLILIAISAVIYYMLNSDSPHSTMLEYSLSDEFIMDEEFPIPHNDSSGKQDSRLAYVGSEDAKPSKDKKLEQEESLTAIAPSERVVPPPPPVQVSDVFSIVDDDIQIFDSYSVYESELSEDSFTISHEDSIVSKLLAYEDSPESLRVIGYGTRAKVAQKSKATQLAMLEHIENEEDFEEAQVFVVVEDMPLFKHDKYSSFQEYISQSIIFPQLAMQSGIQGRVIVNFDVEPDGEVANVRVLRGIDPALDQEALRVIGASPRWQPGKQRGKPVKVTMAFPVNFVLQ